MGVENAPLAFARIARQRHEFPIVNPGVPGFGAHEGRILANRVHDGGFMAQTGSRWGIPDAGGFTMEDS